MDSIVIYKLLAVPFVILFTVFISKKFGAFVGGLVAGLPTFSGPISFFITFEQGADFAVLSSYNSLIGLIGCMTTAVVYCWLAYFKLKWYIAFIGSVFSYFIVGYFLHFLPLFSPIIFVLAVLTSPIAYMIFPTSCVDNFVTTRPRWILPVQILFGSFMVFFVTYLAHIVGPEWSGNLSCFPIMVLVLTPFVHAVSGVYATIIVLRGLAAGWIGTAFFSITIMCLIKTYSIGVVYALATFLACGVSVLYSLLFMQVKKHVERFQDYSC